MRWMTQAGGVRGPGRECFQSSHQQELTESLWHEIDRSRVTNIQELSGNGVIATVDDHQVAAGKRQAHESSGVQAIPCHSVGTIIHMAIDGNMPDTLLFPTS